MHKCISVLRCLIAGGDKRRLPIAERVITEMLTATPKARHKVSLEIILAVVRATRAVASNQVAFVDTVSDYIGELIRGLK